MSIASQRQKYEAERRRKAQAAASMGVHIHVDGSEFSDEAREKTAGTIEAEGIAQRAKESEVQAEAQKTKEATERASKEAAAKETAKKAEESALAKQQQTQVELQKRVQEMRDADTLAVQGAKEAQRENTFAAKVPATETARKLELGRGDSLEKSDSQQERLASVGDLRGEIRESSGNERMSKTTVMTDFVPEYDLAGGGTEHLNPNGWKAAIQQPQESTVAPGQKSEPVAAQVAAIDSAAGATAKTLNSQTAQPSNNQEHLKTADAQSASVVAAPNKSNATAQTWNSVNVIAAPAQEADQAKSPASEQARPAAAPKTLSSERNAERFTESGSEKAPIGVEASPEAEKPEPVKSALSSEREADRFTAPEADQVTATQIAAPGTTQGAAQDVGIANSAGIEPDEVEEEVEVSTQEGEGDGTTGQAKSQEEAQIADEQAQKDQVQKKAVPTPEQQAQAGQALQTADEHENDFGL